MCSTRILSHFGHDIKSNIPRDLSKISGLSKMLWIGSNVCDIVNFVIYFLKKDYSYSRKYYSNAI